jgi:hypothetical protein
MHYPLSNLLSGSIGENELAILSSPIRPLEETLSVQPAAEKKHSREDLSVFFGIGMTINIVMIVAFVVWGIKQWKKHDTSEK